MPNPLTPSRIKATIAGLLGNACERFNRVLQFPQLFYEDHAYKYDESGNFTDEFEADICAIGCVGSGTPGGGGGNPTNPNMPVPTGVNATDGTYSDKVRVTWNAVDAPEGIAEVSQYKVYRALSTVTNPNSATLIANVAAPATQYDDETAAEGVTYNYWVKATNGTETSAFSSSDVGSASAPTTSLDAIADLRATQGFGSVASGVLSLVWTPPTGASHYDIYRNTVNDFATATLVHNDVEPENTADHFSTSANPQCWDNDEEIVLYHQPPDADQKYYFWVVAKKDAPPAVSPESNAAQGWVFTNYAPFTSGVAILNRGESMTEGVDFNAGNIRVIVFGGGGAGGGASEVYGGGGGGAGGIVVEEFELTGGEVISCEMDPDDDETDTTAALGNGDNGCDTLFKIDGVTMITAEKGEGGEFNPAGGGAGGAGGGGSGTTAPTIYPGHAGKPGSGTTGGRSGHRFGNKRYPGAHFNGFSIGSWTGDGPSAGQAGGGGYAAPGTEVLATGGKGKSGYCLIAWGP